MADTLIGYTGFVGSNLKEQVHFEYFFHSRNIQNISLMQHDTIYCAGISSNKFYANSNENVDRENIDNLLKELKKVKCKRFILISTVDVYQNLSNQNEDDFKSNDEHHAYGKNRLYFENEIKKIFNNYYIVRIPGLFGKYLKKNILYDLINNTFYHKVNLAQQFQWYYITDLVNDINRIIKQNIREVNLVTEPIELKKIVTTFFEETSDMIYDDTNCVKYDVRSKYTATGYWYTADEILEKMKKWLNK